MIDPGLWPDKATLAAGDEDKVAPDYLNEQWPDPRSTDNSDGHLEYDDWVRSHPDAGD